MVLFNYSTRELTAKIVYYGPGLCGKTTNLQYVHSTLPENVKGKMLSLATKTDRTLFFDFLPIDLGQIRGMKTRIQLYTVPGQVFYNETRKLVLKGADGIVFVADSQATMHGANVESFKNLEENLKAHGLNLSEMPHVLQFNKRDLPKLSSIEELNAAINKYNAPFYESVATTGIGVQDTLKAVTKLVLLHLTKKYDPKTAAAAAQPRAAAPTPAASAPPPQPAAPQPSPAQTMQMPVASVPGFTDSAGSIPLSESPEVPGAPPAPAPAQAMAPSFGDDEIQDLVDEVSESAMDSVAAVPPTQPEAPAAEPAFDLGGGELSNPPVEQPAPVNLSPPPASEPGPSLGDTATGPSFEIDHGMDPEWAVAPSEAPPAIEPAPPPAVQLSTGATGVDEDEAWDLGSVDDSPSGIDDLSAAAPPVEPEVGSTDRPAEDELPRLTEEVAEPELFGEAGLDVARMKAGEEREIVIPLEVEEPDRTVQRFKLSIRLRMDRAD